MESELCKKVASKECFIFIHVLHYPRIKKENKNSLYTIIIFPNGKFLFSSSQTMLPQEHKTIHIESEKFSTGSREKFLEKRSF